MIRMDTNAAEEGSFKIPVSFTDLSGNSVIPSEILWTLSDKKSTVINNREDVVIAIPEANISIVLQGDDLALPDPYDNLRVLTIKATFDDTGTSLTGLPYREEIIFYIDNLVNIS